jgi:hypothetical protein
MRSLLLLRSALLAALFVAVGLFFATPARAGAEFCPAAVQSPQLFSAPNNDVMAFRLYAYSARGVHGDIDVQTDTGFYTAAFPEVKLALDDATMAAAGTIAFDQTEFVSPPVYVRFPSSVGHVIRVWVTDAQSKGDVDGWDPQGKFDCSALAEPPKPATGALIAKRTNPAPPAATPPTPQTPTIAARSIKPLGTDCEHPFSSVTATNLVPPDQVQGVYLTVPALVLVEVAVAVTSDVTDVEVLQSSGIQALDNAAVEAARGSTYQVGTAFCKPASGIYIYQAEFQPQ